MNTKLKDILPTVRAWQEQGQKTVLVTGVFDLLHVEHIRFLDQAKQAGDKLIIGLETDQRVKQIKGPHRPINPQNLRLLQIASLPPVDLAFILPEKFNQQTDWENLIHQLKPNFLAVSSHTSHLENKQKILRQVGGEVKIVHQCNPAHSTSTTLAQLEHPQTYTAQVKSGHGRGKGLGYPTLNLSVPLHFPFAQGIYAGWVWVGSQKYLGAFHYGPVPTFHQPQPTLEVFLLNRQRDVHRSQVKFQLVAYLRPVLNFSSVPELQTQISQDVQQVKAILSPKS